MKSKYGLLFTAALAGLSLQAAPYVLTTGVGDGTVTVGVDGFGAFGSSVSADSSNAIFDPVGPVGAAGTTFESMVAIRFGEEGPRTWLTSGSAGPNPSISGTSTSASSSFSFGGLNFSLSQTLNNTPTGVLLTQTYAISNPGAQAAGFELLRYIDGDLTFDSSISDGGGRIFSGGTEILFETDSATGSSTEATFVGITGLGGTIPLTGRYEISSYSGLRTLIGNGNTLNDGISGDSGDADQFIDAGNGYDVTLALRNVFSLAAGGSATYTTHTIFGVEAPDDVEEPNPVPEPATVVSGMAFAALAAVRVLRRKK